MTTETTPTHLYVGKRDACIAEVGGLTDIYQGKYLVCPVGDANWDCEGARTLKEVRDIVAHLRLAYPGVIVIYI